MAISQLDRKRIEQDLGAYCETVPRHVRAELRWSFAIRGSAAELFEERAPWDGSKRPWTKRPIAKFRYVEKRAVWELFCVHRDLKWHRYDPLPSAGRFGVLLDEVKRDPTGIFWG